MSPALVESNVVNIALNRFREVWDEPKIVSKYKNGRHGGEWQSYLVSELVAINFRLAAAWIRLGMMPGERVAIMAINRPRWIFTFHSLLAARLVTVTVYPTLTAEEAAFILRDSGSKYVVVDTLAQAEKILSVKDSLPELRGIYVMDWLEREPDAPIGTLDALMASVPEALDVKAMIEGLSGPAPAPGPGIAEQVSARIRSIEPEDTAAIIYTSGTTGLPEA